MGNALDLRAGHRHLQMVAPSFAADRGYRAVTVEVPNLAYESFSWSLCLEAGNVFAQSRQAIAKRFESGIGSYLVGDNPGKLVLLFVIESRTPVR